MKIEKTSQITDFRGKIPLAETNVTEVVSVNGCIVAVWLKASVSISRMPKLDLSIAVMVMTSLEEAELEEVNVPLISEVKVVR